MICLKCIKPWDNPDVHLFIMRSKICLIQNPDTDVQADLWPSYGPGQSGAGDDPGCGRGWPGHEWEEGVRH